jgi:hypothetical protein
MGGGSDVLSRDSEFSKRELQVGKRWIKRLRKGLGEKINC